MSLLQGQTKVMIWDDTCKAQESFRIGKAGVYKPVYLKGHKPPQKGEKVEVLANFKFAETFTVDGYFWVLMEPGDTIVYDKSGHPRRLDCGNPIKGFASVTPPTPPPQQSLAFKPTEEKIVVNVVVNNNPPTTSPAPKLEEETDWVKWLAIGIGAGLALYILLPKEDKGKFGDGGALTASSPTLNFSVGIKAPI